RCQIAQIVQHVTTSLYTFLLQLFLVVRPPRDLVPVLLEFQDQLLARRRNMQPRPPSPKIVPPRLHQRSDCILTAPATLVPRQTPNPETVVPASVGLFQRRLATREEPLPGLVHEPLDDPLPARPAKVNRVFIVGFRIPPVQL